MNAGADIEKELAERYGFTVSPNRVTYADGSHRPSVGVEEILWAALLAEAGERAKLEAQVADYREQANCMGVRTPYKCAAPEEVGHTIYGAFFKVNETEYWCEFHWFKKQIADAAERARGLEAQLERAITVYGADHLRTCAKYSDPGFGPLAYPDLDIECDCGFAALSQLPTPSAEQRAAGGLLPTCHVCGEVMQGVCPACGAKTGCTPSAEPKEKSCTCGVSASPDCPQHGQYAARRLPKVEPL